MLDFKEGERVIFIGGQNNQFILCSGVVKENASDFLRITDVERCFNRFRKGDVFFRDSDWMPVWLEDEFFNKSEKVVNEFMEYISVMRNRMERKEGN